MENLLPIIIAILFFGYKQYKKSFKDTNNQRVTPNSGSDSQYQAENQPDSLNDFISSFMGTEEEEVREPSYTNRFDEPGREEYSFSYDDDEVIEESEKKDDKILVNQDKTEVLQDDNYQESMGKDAVIPKFDLRQAVVYDAVLNPPYINN